ncbi:MAG TPA: mechanosensitive ion channel family protein, partial [Thermodesulfobacteriota bacterium]|nr:mechanosensitive ion channel family protein [Thermodesulfobacteriota bacterium]
ADDGQTFDQARVVVAKLLEEAVAAAKESMGGRDLFWSIGHSLAATLVLCLLIWGATRLRKRIRRTVDSRLSLRLRLARDEHSAIVQLLQFIGGFIFVAIIAAMVEEWLRFVLGRFPFSRPWADGLTGYVMGILVDVGSAIVNAIPGLMMVAVIAGLAQVASRALRTLARAMEAGRFRVLGIDADVARPARQLVTVVIWLFALAMAYPYLPGSGSEAFKGLSVLVGLMLSLGASGVVGQVAGSFILTFSRTLRVGDWVRIGEIEGAVVRVGFVSTKVRTPTDEEVSIPNGVILNTVTRNFSRPAAADASILETSVTIGYSCPWRQIHALILEASARTEGIERRPPPEVRQTQLSDFYVKYSLWVRVRDQARRPDVLSALHANIQDIFNQYGVQIMSPHYRFDPEKPVIVPKERWFEAPAREGKGHPGDGGAPQT